MEPLARTQADNWHATAIAFDGSVVLLTGASGSGKSDLALRCLALGSGPFTPTAPRLLADDRVLLTPHDGRLIASCPAALRGLLEVRGVGIVSISETLEAGPVHLIVELVAGRDVERLPERLEPAVVCGIQVPRWRLAPFEPSAPLKVLLALRAVRDAVSIV